MKPILRSFTPGKVQLGLLAFALAAVLATQAQASTASNTTITNTATVNYNDAGGTPQTAVTATATVTVNLVQSAVVLTSPGNQTISQGGIATLTYTITGTANGPDSYNLTIPVTATNDSTVTATFTTPISLGGTTLAAPAVATNTSITVPYDGIPSNTNVNGTGLQVGSVIQIGTNTYTIATITKNPASNTTTVGLTTAIVGATVAAATIVGEQKTFTVTVPSGIVASGTSGSQSVSATATSATLGTATTSQTTPTVVTVNRAVLTVKKEVAVDGIGTAFATSGNAPPGTILVYRITVTNTGTTNALAVQFTDLVPQYLTYVSGTGKVSTVNNATYGAAANTVLTEGSGGYSYTAGTQTVNYNPGSPGLGTVAGSGVLILFFRATIN